MSADARTPDDHLATLTGMLADHEHMVNVLSHRTHPSKIAKLHEERAAALRWIMQLTAYPIDEDVVL